MVGLMPQVRPWQLFGKHCTEGRAAAATGGSPGFGVRVCHQKKTGQLTDTCFLLEHTIDVVLFFIYKTLKSLTTLSSQVSHTLG